MYAAFHLANFHPKPNGTCVLTRPTRPPSRATRRSRGTLLASSLRGGPNPLDASVAAGAPACKSPAHESTRALAEVRLREGRITSPSSREPPGSPTTGF